MTRFFSFWFYPLVSIVLLSVVVRLEPGWSWFEVAGWLTGGLL